MFPSIQRLTDRATSVNASALEYYGNFDNYRSQGKHCML